MTSHESTAKRSDFRYASGFTDLISLFFGGTFLGIALLSVGNEFHGWPVAIFYFLGGSIIFVHFEKRFDIIRAAILAAVGLGIFWLAMTALAALASNGAYGSDQSSMGYFYAEAYLVTAAFWLLIGVSHRAFRLELDLSGQGEAQGVLLGVVTVAASVLTGAYILLLHFGGGPLHKIGMGPLIAGAIFTVFLVAPLYKAVAQACWRSGIGGALSMKLFRSRWHKALAELDKAHYERAVRFLESHGEPIRQARKVAQSTSDTQRRSSRQGPSGKGDSLARDSAVLEKGPEKLTPRQRRQAAKKLTPKQRRQLARKTTQAQ
jgi:hypothetical protein